MKLLRILVPVLIGLMAAPTIAELNLNTPEGVVAVQRKIHCSTVDGEEKTYVWQGHGYARRPGQPDKLSLIHISGPRDGLLSRMPSSA